jgi:cytochrome c oxidase cbb3-type subunit 4
MDYHQAVYFAQTWGLLLGVTLFAAAVVYALWPSSAERFRRAAHTPLDAEEDHE